MKISKLSRFLTAEQSGSVIIEFAFAIPIMLTLFFATAILARYLQAQEKLDAATTNILDIVNQSKEISSDSLSKLAALLPDMMDPYPVIDGEMQVIFTNVGKGDLDTCQPYAKWQLSFGGSNASKVASGAGAVANTEGIILHPREQLMAVEAYYNVAIPLFAGEMFRFNLAPKMYRRSYGKTRLHDFQRHPVTGQTLPLKCL